MACQSISVKIGGVDYEILASSHGGVVPNPLDPIPELSCLEFTSFSMIYYRPEGEDSMISLAVSHTGGKLVLVDINPIDEHQKWVVHTTYGNIKGEEQENFALVNIATGLALSRSSGELGAPYHVSLTSFQSISRYQDQSALWKVCAAKDGFQRIHTADNKCYLNVDRTHNVVLQKYDGRPTLKFGRRSGKIWNIKPLP